MVYSWGTGGQPTYGSTATLTCDAGFTADGGDTSFACEHSSAGGDGASSDVYAYAAPGSGRRPKCNPVALQALSPPAHASLTRTDDNFFPSTAAYECEAGYSLVGAAERTATADGAWGGGEPRCSDQCAALSLNNAGVCALSLAHAHGLSLSHPRSPLSLVRSLTAFILSVPVHFMFTFQNKFSS